MKVTLSGQASEIVKAHAEAHGLSPSDACVALIERGHKAAESASKAAAKREAAAEEARKKLADALVPGGAVSVRGRGARKAATVVTVVGSDVVVSIDGVNRMVPLTSVHLPETA